MPQLAVLMNSKLVIRDARPGELNRVSLLMKEAYQQYAGHIPPEAWQSYLADIMDVRGRLGEADLLVAETDGKLAGAVTLYLKPAGSTHRGWPAGWAGIRLLAVKPRYRGRGIGRALMDECVRRCRAAGIRAIGLHTTEIMNVAQRMYERMGFVRAPEFDFRPRPGVVVMAYRFDLVSGRLPDQQADIA